MGERDGVMISGALGLFVPMAHICHHRRLDAIKAVHWLVCLHCNLFDVHCQIYGNGYRISSPSERCGCALRMNTSSPLSCPGNLPFFRMNNVSLPLNNIVLLLEITFLSLLRVQTESGPFPLALVHFPSVTVALWVRASGWSLNPWIRFA